MIKILLLFKTLFRGHVRYPTNQREEEASRDPASQDGGREGAEGGQAAQRDSSAGARHYQGSLYTVSQLQYQPT